MISLDLWRYTVRVSDAIKLRQPGDSRRSPWVALVAVLALWTACTLAFALFPVGSDGRAFTASGAYLASAIFAVACLARAISKSRNESRTLWSLIGAGMLAWFIADAGWSGLPGSGLTAGGLSYPHLLYLVSYLFFVGALLLLVRRTVSGIALVTALDALAVALSSGVLIWYFLLTDTASSVLSPALFATLSWPLFDAALVFLGLVVLSAEARPAFTGLLTLGFLAFAVADALYLGSNSRGLYEIFGWPDPIWSLGVVLIGGAALNPALPENPAERSRINPWRVFAFWLGPLSPPIQLSLVLLWGALNPPLPAYVPVCGAILLVYLAGRVALVSFVTRRVSNEREEAARALEQSHILYELHDSVKQNVHGISLTLRAALGAERDAELGGDREAAREMLERALKVSREAEFQISRPYDELRSLRRETPPGASEFLRHRLRKFEEYFGVKTHDDLQASLDILNPAEVAAVTRVTVEAFWNVAKHSGAHNLYFESRSVGSLLIVRIRDDGRGFDTANPPPGLGLEYMKQRAAEAGAKLDVISTPGHGTTVQLRFEQ